MSSKIIIFDFDGTLADSSSVIRNVYNELALEHSWPTMNEADYQRLRGLGVVEAQRWIGVKSWQIPGLMREGLKRFKEHSSGIELFEGVPGMVMKLASSGNVMYILSTNNPQTIKEVLGRYGIADQITVLRRSALFAKDYAIRHLMSKQKYVPQNVWMVGDEVRDIEAAKKAKVNAVAVNWGLQTTDLLEAAKPDLIVNDTAELLKALSN